MNRGKKITGLIMASLLIVLVLPLSIVHAQGNGNGNGGGGGGGGGGGDGEPELEFIELETGQAGSATAYAINNAGIVVGVVDAFAGTWDANHQTPTFTPLAASGFGVARAINEAGEIVGSVLGQPAYWADLQADPIALPLPQGFMDGQAIGISSDGIVVGEASTLETTAAVAWRINGGVVFGPLILSPMNAGANGVALLESGLNRAVGESPSAGGSNVATAWDIEVIADGSIILADTTVLVSDRWSRAYAITELGDICGIFADTRGNDLGWTDTAFVIRGGSLDTLPCGRRNEFCVARDLNDSEVVGATGRVQAEDAARWNSRNKLEEIIAYFNASWSQSDAFGTNDLGEVVGSGDKIGTGIATAWLLRKTSNQ